MSRLVKRSFSLAGHRTSVALEPEFWAVLARVAVERRQTLSALVSGADGARGTGQPLASALRVLALHAADEEPHQASGPAGDGTASNDMAAADEDDA